MIFQFSKNDKMIFSVAWNTMFTDYWKVLILNFPEIEIRYFYLKSWWKHDIYWLLESTCFELFRGGKYGLFLSQKVDGKMMFTDYWKVFVLNVSEMENTVFFWAKKLRKNDIYWLYYLLSIKNDSTFFPSCDMHKFHALVGCHAIFFLRTFF